MDLLRGAGHFIANAFSSVAVQIAAIGLLAALGYSARRYIPKHWRELLSNAFRWRRRVGSGELDYSGLKAQALATLREDQSIDGPHYGQFGKGAGLEEGEEVPDGHGGDGSQAAHVSNVVAYNCSEKAKPSKIQRGPRSSRRRGIDAAGGRAHRANQWAGEPNRQELPHLAPTHDQRLPHAGPRTRMVCQGDDYPRRNAGPRGRLAKQGRRLGAMRQDPYEIGPVGLRLCRPFSSPCGQLPRA